MVDKRDAVELEEALKPSELVEALKPLELEEPAEFRTHPEQLKEEGGAAPRTNPWDTLVDKISSLGEDDFVDLDAKSKEDDDRSDSLKKRIQILLAQAQTSVSLRDNRFDYSPSSKIALNVIDAQRYPLVYIPDSKSLAFSEAVDGYETASIEDTQLWISERLKLSFVALYQQRFMMASGADSVVIQSSRVFEEDVEDILVRRLGLKSKEESLVRSLLNALSSDLYVWVDKNSESASEWRLGFAPESSCITLCDPVKDEVVA